GCSSEHLPSSPLTLTRREILMANSTLFLATTVTSALTAGVLPQLVGALKQPLAQRLGVDEKRARGLTASAALALVVMMLVGGLLIDKWGVRGILTAGCFLAALGLSFLSLSRSFLPA